jgi:hypothetical protein
MNPNKLALAILLIAFLGLTGCNSAREIWSAAIKKCAKNDQLGSTVIYFGPSNKVGPGSTFTTFESGGIQVSDLPADYGLPLTAVLEGSEYSCDVLTKSGFDFSASAPISELIGVPADVALTIKTAKSRNVTTKSIQWVEVAVGRFKDHVKNLPDDHPVKLRMEQGDMVLARALRVRGLEATIKFEGKAAPTVRASIPAVIPAGTAKDVSLAATWTDDSTLVIKSSADFYIAGELRKYSKGGLASAGGEPDIGPLVEKQSELKVDLSKAR